MSRTHDLDTATAIRIIGDSHGGVVLQAHWNNHPSPFTLQLLRNDHWGMGAISADAADALGNAIDVIDLRDSTVNQWPQRAGTSPVLKPARLTRASVHGRGPVAELLHAHAEYVRNNEDLSASPLAAMRFTSALIASAMAEAYELPSTEIVADTDTEPSVPLV